MCDDDLARERGDRAREVAEHPHLDLRPVHELLDHDLLVVAAGEPDGGLQLRLLAHLRDPDRRAHVRRLDEDGVAEGVHDRVAEPERDVTRDGDAGAAHERLEDVLVHADATEASTPGPT